MLAFLTRNRRQETAVTTETTPAAPATDVVMRFLTQGGAEVRVTKRGRSERTTFSGTTYGFMSHGWRCLGCDKASDYYKQMEDWEARDEANEHAATCRAMPKQTAA